MPKNYLSLALTILLFHFSAIPGFAARQDEREARQAAKAKAAIAKRGVGEKAHVKVKLRNKTEVKGYVSQAGEDSFTVTNAKTGQATTVAYNDVGEVEGKGLSKGTKIALFVGAGVLITLVVIGVSIAHSLGGFGGIGPIR
jgi:ABC-type dipeptide/oligopeptide/nickel transport system permease subunit